MLQGAWPQESYFSVVQNIWTAGRIPDPANPNNIIWDLGRVPYDPEDCYISELVACLSEISEGMTESRLLSVKAMRDAGFAKGDNERRTHQPNL